MKQSSISVFDVTYFAAEVAVYVFVFWWGFSRELPTAMRWMLALGLVAVFATAWGLLAAPTASAPLSGVADVAFRVVWFGLGVLAAVAVLATA